MPPGLDGISVAARLLGHPQAEPRRPLYWDRVFGWRGGTPRAQAVRLGDWKAVRLRPQSPLELYDLAKDIGERHDVAAAHLEVAAELGLGAPPDGVRQVRDGGAAV